MDKIKKDTLVLILGVSLVVIVAVITCVNLTSNRRQYSLADYGIQPLSKPDCSSLEKENATSPVNISLNAPNVSSMRDKIKALIPKYNGKLTSDSFNSYPSYPSYSPSPMPVYPIDSYSQDSANLVITFEKSQNEFLTELADVVKAGGGINTGYNYVDTTDPQYSYGYSSYSSCISSMQSVKADMLQLEIFTNALRKARSGEEVSLIGQSIANSKINLQNDVSMVNNFFAISNKPSVNISINAIQK